MECYYIFVLLFFGAALAQTIDELAINANNPDVTEGDMILTPEQKKILYLGSDKKNGVTNPSARWPNAIVYYQFTGSIRK